MEPTKIRNSEYVHGIVRTSRENESMKVIGLSAMNMAIIVIISIFVLGTIGFVIYNSAFKSGFDRAIDIHNMHMRQHKKATPAPLNFYHYSDSLTVKSKKSIYIKN